MAFQQVPATNHTLYCYYYIVCMHVQMLVVSWIGAPQSGSSHARLLYNMMSFGERFARVILDNGFLEFMTEIQYDYTVC